MFGLNNIYSGKVHDIHIYIVKIIGFDSKGLFTSFPRHIIKSAFLMMVLDESVNTQV